LIIEAADGKITVREADDCRKLHVAAAPQCDIDATLCATGVGRLGLDDKVLLDVEQLHVHAAAAATRPGWESDWDAMISYASAKGWVTSDGRSLIAHIERR
jgi:hypothetical protein